MDLCGVSEVKGSAGRDRYNRPWQRAPCRGGIKTRGNRLYRKPYQDEVLLAAVRSSTSLRERDATQESEKAPIGKGMASLLARERQVLDGLVSGNANKIMHMISVLVVISRWKSTEPTS